MSGYTKLFSSILDSSIWQEDDRTRLVWITMLAMADQHGEIHASIPGLAKRAGVPIDAAEVAILKLSNPDPYSRTPDYDGRRIAKIDGGWEILNHAKYRFMASIEDRKEKAAERQRRRRNGLQKAESGNTTECDTALHSVTPRDMSLAVTLLPDKQKQSQMQNVDNTPEPPEGGACVHPDPSPKAQRRRRDPNSIPDGFDGFWCLYPRKVAKGDAIKAWMQMSALTHWNEIKRAIEASIGSENWVSEGGKYIPYPGTWLRARRWEDQLDLPIETKESIARQMRANRAWDKHPDHANATAEDRIAFAELLARYKAMS